MSAWQASRPGDKILQLDLPLSYGIFDHFQDPDALNAVQFLWDPTKDVGVYIKVDFFSPSIIIYYADFMYLFMYSI